MPAAPSSPLAGARAAPGSRPESLLRRIDDRATFAAFRGARRGRSGPVSVTRLPGDSVRVAFAVGKPVGTAVVRNRVRRRLREAVRVEARAGRLAPGDYLVRAGPEAAASSFAELAEHVRLATERSAGAGRVP